MYKKSMHAHTYMDFYSYICNEDRLLIPNGGCLNLAGQSFILFLLPHIKFPFYL